MKPIILRQHEVIHLRYHGSVIAWRVVKDTGLYAIDPDIHGEDVSRRELKAFATQCPYGRTGEEGWVRETFRFDGIDHLIGIARQDRSEVVYKADLFGDRMIDDCPWAPSTHMPRWASRFTVTLDVGLKRIQEVTEEEAVESGVFWFREYCQRGCQDFDESMTDLQLFKVLTEWKNKGLNLDRNDYFWKITCTLKK